jgi:hypothetical protein
VVSEQEAWEQRMVWWAKPLVTIRAELYKVNGKHAKLCNEAARRLEEFSRHLQEVRSDRDLWRRVAEELESKRQSG